jgi:acetyltransferase-like isoleucine patch superfamily enzyme
MARAGLSWWGRLATRLATWAAPPYKGKRFLAQLSPAGYVSPRAQIACRDLRLGRFCYIDDDVVIFDRGDGGHVAVGDGAHLYRGTIIELGQGGSVEIGANSHIQPNCQFTAFVGNVCIGAGVQVAPACAFYPYQHSFSPDQPITRQPLHSKGDIVIEADAWLGYGVIVLDGVTIGAGAVVGAGAVITHDVPPQAIVAGVPARILGYRTATAFGSANPETQ